MYVAATVLSQVLYQKNLLFTLEQYIFVRFLYWTGVRTLSTVIRNDSIRYYLAYYAHVNTSSLGNLK